VTRKDGTATAGGDPQRRSLAAGKRHARYRSHLSLAARREALSSGWKTGRTISVGQYIS